MGWALLLTPSGENARCCMSIESYPAPYVVLEGGIFEDGEVRTSEANTANACEDRLEIRQVGSRQGAADLFDCAENLHIQLGITVPNHLVQALPLYPAEAERVAAAVAIQSLLVLLLTELTGE